MPPSSQRNKSWRSALSATALLALALPLSGADEEAGDAPPPKGPTPMPALDLLIEGSVLEKVTIPSYDDARRVTSVLRAKTVTLVDRDTFAFEMEDLRLALFDADLGNPRIALGEAELRNFNDALVEPGEDGKRPEGDARLISHTPVSVEAEEFSISGTGLVFYLNSRRGFLQGPVHAEALVESQTAMNPLRPTIAAAALLGAAAAAPEDLQPDPQEIQGLDRLAESRAALVEAARTDANAQLQAAAQAAEQADDTLSGFLKKAALEKPAGPLPDLTSKVPDPEEPVLKLPAELTCDGGVYFDPEQLMLIFLKNVDAKHPQFHLSGADEVKVFFKKLTRTVKAGDGSGEIKEKESLKPTVLVATGTLVIEGEADTGQEDAQPFKASGRELVYDFAEEDLILRGGQPWVMSPQFRGRITEPDGMFRINRKTHQISANRAVEAIIETEDLNKED